MTAGRSPGQSQSDILSEGGLVRSASRPPARQCTESTSRDAASIIRTSNAVEIRVLDHGRKTEAQQHFRPR